MCVTSLIWNLWCQKGFQYWLHSMCEMAESDTRDISSHSSITDDESVCSNSESFSLEMSNIYDGIEVLPYKLSPNTYLQKSQIFPACQRMVNCFISREWSVELHYTPVISYKPVKYLCMYILIYLCGLTRCQ